MWAMFRRLYRYLQPYRWIFLGALALVFLGSGLELLKPWPVKLAVDQIIERKPLDFYGVHIPFETLEVAWQLAIAIGMLLLVHFLTSLVQLVINYLTIRIGQNMVHDFRGDLFEHLQRQSLLFHHKTPAGDLLYRLMGDTYAVQALFMNGVFSTVSNVALLIGMFVVLMGLDPLLTLYSLAVLPFLAIAIHHVTGKIGSLSSDTYVMESKAYSTAERVFSSIGIVQAFAREDDERSKFLKESKTSFDLRLSLYSLQTAYGGMVGLLTAAGTALVLFIGVLHVLDHRLTTGELLVFLAYLASLYGPLNHISNTAASIQSAMAQAKRVLTILDHDEAVEEKPDAKPLVVTKGEVRYEHVTFGYDPERPVFRDISFDCPPGTLTALVGQTGAGKTSLMSLLMRFFDPQQGRITIDGQDLRDVTLKSLREQVAVVLQDTQLFPMTVRENIAYGKQNATMEEIVRAARMANAEEFILRMPEGYETVLGEKGATVSGGQRQRIAIARAILKDSPILVMDEPTSALDAKTEDLIMEGLERLMAGRTTFVIAHRLSLVRRADQILVVGDGQLLEKGNYEQLLAREGDFARLHAIQNKQRANMLPTG